MKPMKPMRIVRVAAGSIGEEMKCEPWPVNQTLHHEVAPGCFLFLSLGPHGLLISNGSEAVGVRLDEMVKLAQYHEPAFIPGIKED